LNIIILTHQEELNLPHALRRLKGLDCEIFVLWKSLNLFAARPPDVARGWGEAATRSRC
jgi:hypothetical protein